MMGIYRIDGPNDMIYIGRALDIHARWSGHISAMKAGHHSNRLIQEDYKLYGVNAFKFSIVEIVGHESGLAETELKWLNKVLSQFPRDRVYNIASVKVPHKIRRTVKRKPLKIGTQEFILNGTKILV
jgi:group I intron endonuclease